MSTRVRGTGAVRSGKQRHMSEIESEILEAHIRRAYQWNYSDGEIALYADCSDKTVLRWRQKRNLPANGNGGGHRY